MDADSFKPLIASAKHVGWVRGLSRNDRDDITQEALLWCWEHRDSPSPSTSLNTWFVNAVRHAYKRWRREQRKWPAVTVLIPINSIGAATDVTLVLAETLNAWQTLSRALPRKYQRIAQLDARGYTTAEMVSKGLSKRTIEETRARVHQLRRLVPDEHDDRLLPRSLYIHPENYTPPTALSDDAHEPMSQQP